MGIHFRHIMAAHAATLLVACVSSAVPNPVVRGVADAGLLRFNGRYFLMGVGTHGSMHMSQDLVNWSDPKHVFSMRNAWATGPAGGDDQIHACDMHLVNGRFHLYWSVNFGDLRQIGHAVADDVLGPYTEPVTDAPLDGRIDPALFQDEDGSLHFYTVKFSMGNVIWGQPMGDPWSLTGEAVPMLSALRATWELQDHAVNEAPWVLRNGGRYYMLYNANHTADSFGHYAIGVAETDTPMGFSNEDKYPFPVLTDSPDPGRAIRNCGQPNVVRGPNGFEWWIAYFAIYGDNLQRSQAVDRLFFHGRELMVDGPTAPETAGWHPTPAMPTFRDFFETPESLSSGWNTKGGTWKCRENTLLQTKSQETTRALPDLPGATHYLIEAAVRLEAAETGRLGVIAWRGEGAEICVGLDRDTKAFFWERTGEKPVRVERSLPDAFLWLGWHTFRVEKNGESLRVWFDGIAPPCETTLDTVGGRGSAGLFTQGGTATFGPFSFTRGWEESCGDTGLHGWATEGSWAIEKGGLVATGKATAFKGDPLEAFEWNAQLVPGEGGECGVYAVHCGHGDFLLVSSADGFTTARLSGMRNGEPIAGQETVVPQARRRHSPAENGYNVRTVRHGGRVLIFVDGVPIFGLDDVWPAARAGLFSASGTCRFTDTGLIDLGSGFAEALGTP